MQHADKNNNTEPGERRSGGYPHAPPDPVGEWLKSVRGSLSPHTLRALHSDLGRYRSWCMKQRLKPWPVRATSLARFIDTLAKERAPATVERHVYSILSLCRGMGWKDPRNTGAVRTALGRMRRTKGRRQAQAHGLTRALLERMTEASGDRLIDVRNRAMLAVAYDALLRRSELVSLQVADLAMESDGSATLLVRRGKTDPGGEGAVLYLAPDTVSLVLAWLDGSGVGEGCLFRAVSRYGRTGRGLDPGQVPRIYKSMARRAGLGEEVVAGLSGHSPRVGAAQDMIALRVELPAIMQAGRWKSTAMVHRYGERILPRRSGSAQLAELQYRLCPSPGIGTCTCSGETCTRQNKSNRTGIAEAGRGPGKSPSRGQLSRTGNRRNPGIFRESRQPVNRNNPGFMENRSPPGPRETGIGAVYLPIRSVLDTRRRKNYS